MIEFARPWLFLINIPLLIFWGWWLWIQYRALRWLKSETARSFRKRFTIYRGHAGPVLHLLGLALLVNLLIAAAAGPHHPKTSGNIAGEAGLLLLLDASFSMVAQDVTQEEDSTTGSKSRLAQAKRFAAELVSMLPEMPIGLISFSGVAVIHAPPTLDHTALLSLIRTLTLHSSENTGSRFESALEETLHVAHDRQGRLTVVMLSDGEIPHESDFEPMLPLLRRENIQVHTVGFGSDDGAGIVLYDPSDILAGKEKPTVIREAWSRRDMKNLRLIARETGGECWDVAGGHWADDLAGRLQEAFETVEKQAPGEQDLSHWPVMAAILLFLFEALILKIVSARRWRTREKSWTR